MEKTCLLGWKAIGSVVVLSIATKGAFLAFVVPLGAIFYKFQLYYRASNTEVSRLVARSFSPILVEFAQQLSALPSLRAYDALPRCVEALRAKIIVFNTTSRMKNNLQIWLLMRLQTLGSSISFFCIVLQVSALGPPSPCTVPYGHC